MIWTSVGVISAFAGGVPLLMIVVAFIKFYPFSCLAKYHLKLCGNIPYIMTGGNDGRGSTIVPVLNIHNKPITSTKRPINSNPGKENNSCCGDNPPPLNMDIRVIKTVDTDEVHVRFGYRAEVTQTY